MRKIILLCGFAMLGSWSLANTWDETSTVAEDPIGCTITTIVRHYVNGEYSHSTSSSYWYNGDCGEQNGGVIINVVKSNVNTSLDP